MWYDSLTPLVEKILSDKVFLEKEPFWENLKQKDLNLLRKREYNSVDFSQLSILQEFKISKPVKISSNEITKYLHHHSYFLIFINGHFEKEYSSYPSFIQIKEEKSCISKEEENLFLQEKQKHIFSLFHLIFSQEETVIEIEAQAHLDKPIEVLHFILEEKNEISFPKVFFHVKEEAILSVYTKIIPLKGSIYYPEHTFLLEKEANVNYYSIRNNLDENVETLFAILKKKAHFSMTNSIMELKKNILEGSILLLGAESFFFRRSLSMLNKTNEDHTFLKIEHLAKQSQSNIQCKKVLLEKALSNFKGEIWIKPEAELSESSLVNHNLLLSDKAHALSSPEMRIFADDVKAFHGATISELQEKELFYLRARGLAYKEAFYMLVLGFCEDVIDFVPQDALKDELIAKVKKILS